MGIAGKLLEDLAAELLSKYIIPRKEKSVLVDRQEPGVMLTSSQSRRL